jgi:hypothetical protein
MRIVPVWLDSENFYEVKLNGISAVILMNVIIFQSWPSDFAQNCQTWQNPVVFCFTWF